MLNVSQQKLLNAFVSVIKSWGAINPPDEQHWHEFICECYPDRTRITKNDVESFLVSNCSWSAVEAGIAAENFDSAITLLDAFETAKGHWSLLTRIKYVIQHH